MSWTYTNDPAHSKLDECRFTIGDTNSEEPILQDEEIQYLIDKYSNQNMLLYQLFFKAATIFARDIKRSLGPMSEDPTKRLDFFKAQADFYKQLAATANISTPTYSYPKVFKKGMQNNPPHPFGGHYV